MHSLGILHLKNDEYHKRQEAEKAREAKLAKTIVCPDEADYTNVPDGRFLVTKSKVLGVVIKGFSENSGDWRTYLDVTEDGLSVSVGQFTYLLPFEALKKAGFVRVHAEGKAHEVEGTNEGGSPSGQA